MMKNREVNPGGIMKKIIYLFVCFVFVFVAGCVSNKPPQPDNPGLSSNTETPLNQGEDDAPDIPEWQRAYLDLLLTAQDYISNFDWSVSRDYDARYPLYITDIKLADLNFDGTPELIIYGESALASSDAGIYTAVDSGAQKIFAGLLYAGVGPSLYRDPDDGAMYYGFTRLEVLPDDIINYLFTVYMTHEKTVLTDDLTETAVKAAVYTADFGDDPNFMFNEENVSEEDYHVLVDNLFTGFVELSGYPVSIKDLYPDDYKDSDYIYSESEILQFFDMYSPEPTNRIDAEIEYAAIINLYRDFVDGDDKDEGIEQFLIDIADDLNITDEQLLYGLNNSLYELYDDDAGYAIRDINNDGIPELFIISKEYHDIYAIYTLRRGNPVLLGAYWSRNRCAVDNDGIIYINGSGGASDNFFMSYALIPGTGYLNFIEAYDDDPVYPDNPTKNLGLDIIGLRK